MTEEALKASVSELCVYAKLHDTDCRKPARVDWTRVPHGFGSGPRYPVSVLAIFGLALAVAPVGVLLVVCSPVVAHTCMSHVEILAVATGFTRLNMPVLLHPSAMNA